MNTGRRLKARIKRNLNAQQPPRSMAWLADELGISRSYLHMLLSGDRRMSLAMAVQLEEKTGVSIREFAKVA